MRVFFFHFFFFISRVTAKRHVESNFDLQLIDHSHSDKGLIQHLLYQNVNDQSIANQNLIRRVFLLCVASRARQIVNQPLKNAQTTIIIWDSKPSALAAMVTKRAHVLTLFKLQHSHFKVQGNVTIRVS